MCNLDRALYIPDLILMFGLSSFQLFNVFDINVLSEGSHSLLPSSHRIKLFVSIDTFLSSIKELFTHFERADKHEPRLPDISSRHLLPLRFEPVALILNKFFSSCISALFSKLNEIISQPMSVDGLGSYVNTSFQLVESECALKPCNETSPHHFSTEHISDSLKFGDLLK